MSRIFLLLELLTAILLAVITVAFTLPYGGYLKSSLFFLGAGLLGFRLYAVHKFKNLLEDFEGNLDACRMDAEGRETYKVQMKDRIDGELQRVGHIPAYAKFFFNGEQCDLFAVVRRKQKYPARNYAREQQEAVKR